MQEIRAQITGIKEEQSKHTHTIVKAVFFKGEHGGSYRTWLDPNNANFVRWNHLLMVGNVLENIHLKKGSTNLIDADSFPSLYIPPADKATQTESQAETAPESVNRQVNMLDVEPTPRKQSMDAR